MGGRVINLITFFKKMKLLHANLDSEAITQVPQFYS
jgi:hypothetical protein